MPRRRLNSLVAQLIAHISAHCGVGTQFLTIREVADQFKVSPQLAHKAVRALIEHGVLNQEKGCRPKVHSLQPRRTLSGKRVAVVSCNRDRTFNEAFLAGIELVLSEYGIEPTLHTFGQDEIQSLAFGHKLVELGADGCIALNFKAGELGFYHAMREGLDVVTDLPLTNLPILHHVSPPNQHYAQVAGRALRERGHRHILTAGPYTDTVSRYTGLKSAFAGSSCTLEFVDTRQPDAQEALDHFFDTFTREKAVYSLRYLTNYQLAASFLRFGVEVKNDNFVAFEIPLGQSLVFPGLGTIQGTGLSFDKIGRRLAAHIVAKWETGSFPFDHW